MSYYCGIDLGGTNIAAGIVDEEYRILSTTSAPTPKMVDGKTLGGVTPPPPATVSRRPLTMGS